MSFLFATPLWADVLFIDINNAREEVEAARKAAAARGERLIVVPGVSAELQERLSAADTELARAKRQQNDSCKEAGTDCDEAKRRVRQAEQGVKAAEKQLPQVNANNLSRAFTKIKERGISLSSVIVSGHDGNRLYYGRLGEVSEKAIEKAFAANKPLCESVRSLYLWGCYTATTDDFIRGWKSACANTSMIAGFSGQSPASIRPESGLHLNQLMLKEAELLGTRDKSELERIFMSLDRVKDMKSAVCIDRDIVLSRKGVTTVKEEVAACFDLNDVEKQKNFDTFNCFRLAQEGCESVPDDLSRGPLRAVYDYFQVTAHCTRAFNEYNKRNPDNPKHWPITPYAARRVLFDNNVRKNFEKLHKNELNDFNKLLDELGVDPSLRMKNLSGMNRKRHLDTIRGLQRAFRDLEPGARDENGRWVDSRVLAMGYYINELIKVEKGECIPLSWVEPADNLSESSCKIKANMQNARGKARAIAGD